MRQQPQLLRPPQSRTCREGTEIPFELGARLRAAESACREELTGAIGEAIVRAVERCAGSLLKGAARIQDAAVVVDLDERPDRMVVHLPGDSKWRDAIGMVPLKADVVITVPDLLEMERAGAPLHEKPVIPIVRALLSVNLQTPKPG
jgi:hypothetical protein